MFQDELTSSSVKLGFSNNTSFPDEVGNNIFSFPFLTITPGAVKMCLKATTRGATAED